MSAASPWLVSFAARPQAKLSLFCFHHAGVGAAAYRPWALAAPQDVEVICVQLPGRGSRMGERPIERIEEIVSGITDALRDRLERPFAFFGHSMGSLIAFETAHALAARALPLPLHVFVSGRRPPHVPDPHPPLDGLDDAGFVDAIDRRYGGIPPAIRQDAEVLALLLPSLRADIRALERYGVRPTAPLAVAITAYGGAQDLLTPAAHLEAWRPLTTAPFRRRQFPGGHFYVDSERAALMADIVRTLQASVCEADR